MARPTYKNSDKRGGCLTCKDGEPEWFGPSARRKAREHHGKTGHETWYEENLGYRWGGVSLKSQHDSAKGDK